MKLTELPELPKHVDCGAAFVPGGAYYASLDAKKVIALEARLHLACELLELHIGKQIQDTECDCKFCSAAGLLAKLRDEGLYS